MNANRIEMYLRMDDKYHFVLRAWRHKSSYAKKLGTDAIYFESWDSILLKPDHVKHIHFNYPQDGSLHKTYEYEDGKKVHIHPERYTITVPRNPKTLHELPVAPPTAEDLQRMGFMGPYIRPPAFSEYKPDTVIGLPIGGGFPLPHGKPEIFNPVSERENDWDVLDTGGMVGTLNVHVFLAGSPDAELTFAGDWVPKFRTKIVRGVEPPYFGVMLTLFRNEPEAEMSVERP